jgi:hypothetical protein
VCRSKHVEPSVNVGIINSITKLHLVGISTESSTMHGSMSTKFTHLLNDYGRLTPSNSPYSEADIFSASQEIPHILLNPWVHYRVHDSSPHVPTLSRFNPFHSPSSCSRAVLVLSYLCLGLPSVLFPSVLPTKTWKRFCSPPDMPHAPSISSLLISSPK